MDLSFARFEQDAHVTVLPPDLAVLMVGVVARQGASPTALVQARLDRPALAAGPLAPASGAFNAAVAAMLAASLCEGAVHANDEALIAWKGA